MDKNIFRFKYFDVNQKDASMKVGTDGVLLGSWVNCENSSEILDIGTGTGLISLMIAQRFTSVRIKSIEIQEKAFLEAKDNFKNSRWSDRIDVFNISLQEFNDQKFDFIVSNPPFHVNKIKSKKSQINLSKHIENLTFEILLKKTKELLNENGKAGFIISFEDKKNFIEMAKDEGFFLLRNRDVKGNENSKIKRSLLEFSLKQKEVKYEETLIIEKKRNIYTEEYKNLTKDFYINM